MVKMKSEFPVYRTMNFFKSFGRKNSVAVESNSYLCASKSGLSLQTIELDVMCDLASKPEYECKLNGSKSTLWKYRSRSTSRDSLFSNDDNQLHTYYYLNSETGDVKIEQKWIPKSNNYWWKNK